MIGKFIGRKNLHDYAKLRHSGKAQNCPRCKTSAATRCHYCDHALTGQIDIQGRTTCEACNKQNWLGVGNYND